MREGVNSRLTAHFFRGFESGRWCSVGYALNSKELFGMKPIRREWRIVELNVGRRREGLMRIMRARGSRTAESLEEGTEGSIPGMGERAGFMQIL